MGTKWITQENKTKYVEAIAIAQGVVDKADATKENIDEAVQNLANATATFRGEQQDGTKVGEVVVPEVLKDLGVTLTCETKKEGVKGFSAVMQETDMDITLTTNGLTKEQQVTVAGKNVQLAKGDKASNVKQKIIEAFKGDADWKVETGRVAVTDQKAGILFTSLKPKAHVENLCTDSEEIKFTIHKDESGVLKETKGIEAIPEVKGEFEITVTNKATKTGKITVNITAEGSSLNQDINIDLEGTDDTKVISEKIYNAIKENVQLKNNFTFKNDKESSKITVTEKIGDPIKLKAVIK
ncbi:hypothetical protein C3495_11765 [Clostridiaceae bacterium 14S0207]|nr:hypothetical protein C3495_11765 [Clostridiaceae bacterium 14S0207]